MLIVDSCLQQLNSLKLIDGLLTFVYIEFKSSMSENVEILYWDILTLENEIIFVLWVNMIRTQCSNQTKGNTTQQSAFFFQLWWEPKDLFNNLFSGGLWPTGQGHPYPLSCVLLTFQAGLCAACFFLWCYCWNGVALAMYINRKTIANGIFSMSSIFEKNYTW